MKAGPQYQQYFIRPYFGEPATPDRLIWHLYGPPGKYHYRCMNALKVGAREEDCSTPEFPSLNEISAEALQYMARFAVVVQIGYAIAGHVKKEGETKCE